MTVMIWLWLAGCSGIPISSTQREELASIRHDVVAMNAPLDGLRKIRLRDARATLGPRPDLGPCPVPVRTPSSLDVGTFSADGRTFHLGTAPISVVRTVDLDTSSGPRMFRIRVALVDDVQSMLYYTYRAADLSDLEQSLVDARRLRQPDWMDVDATLLIDRYLQPRVQGKTFEAGRLQGRFYVYRYSSGQVICAADVWADSSDRLGVRKHLDENGIFRAAASDLDRDLYRRGVEAGIGALSVAGPRVFAVD